jgi:hypothetical protein
VHETILDAVPAWAETPYDAGRSVLQFALVACATDLRIPNESFWRN